MPTRIVVGLQWGDEGKGKTVDAICEREHPDIVARYQGGGNAGHTVEIKGEQFILHTIPSGILHSETTNICGTGMVIDMEALVKEMDELNARNIELGNLKISSRAPVLFAYHRLWEQIAATSKKIDTTKRGIGPCYTDKYAREGVRLCDMLARPDFATKVILANTEEYNDRARAVGGAWVHPEAHLAWQFELLERLQHHIADTDALIRAAQREGKNILLEGAQGTMLDIDYGTYPFVTSSHTIAGGGYAGGGLLPRRGIDQVIGILKAYTTRVGEGHFPTEQNNETGQRLRERGHEFGATTGRPRRCGWLDLVQTCYALDINDASEIALTKLDVLDEEPVIKVAVAYRKGTETTTKMPEVLDGWEPIYEEFEGWQTPTRECRTREQLPRQAQAYVGKIQERIRERLGFEVPIKMISVGKERDETIWN